jgi:PhnB protein
MAAVNPYLSFNGNCREAFNFYKSAFGGEFVSINTYGEGGIPHLSNEKEKDKIMHVALPVGKNTFLMGSDRPDEMGAVGSGDNFSIAIQADSEAEADQLFQALSAGGKIAMPMGKAPWGAYFGMFSDKFGIQWMINCDA